MRKKDETLQATILDMARQMADAAGPGSINIRAVAEKAGIATGTVYNYFPSKDALLLALTEEYWHETLLEMREIVTADLFYRQLEEIYGFLHQRMWQSGGTLMGSLGNVEAAGRERMQSMQQVLERALVQRMELDTRIRTDIWHGAFTKQRYASFILMNLTLLLQRRVPEIEFFIELVKRTLYEQEENHYGTGNC